MEENNAQSLHDLLTTLPREIIEYITLFFASNITLESIACTSKQLRSVVSKLFAKTIRVETRTASKELRHSTEKMIVRGNGDISWIEKIVERQPSGAELLADDSVKKKVISREKCANLSRKLQLIMESTDLTKYAEQYQLKQHLFSLHYHILSINIEVDNKHMKYYYDSEYNTSVVDRDPDVHSVPFEELQWENLNEIMITRLKCALCATEVLNFCVEITAIENRRWDYGNDTIHVLYYANKLQSKGWELECLSTGGIRSSRWCHDQTSTIAHSEEMIVVSGQITPSAVNELYLRVAKYFKTKNNINKDDDNSVLHSTENNGFEGSREIQIQIPGLNMNDTISKTDLEEFLLVLEPVTKPFGIALPHE